MTGGAHLSASAAMNDRLWPLIRAGDRAWPAGTTYADTVADMDAWLTARIAHLRAAYAHTWDAGVVTREPTCTSTGTRVYTSDAGETMTETIPARAHAPEALPAVAATCTTPGPDRGQPVRPLRRGADGAGDHPRRAPLCQRGLHRLRGKRPGVRSVPRRESLSGQQIHRYAARGQLGAQRH